MCPVRDFGSCTRYRLRHPLFVEGFEQIIDGIHFKCFYGVLIESGAKDDLRQRDFSIQQLFDYAKAIEAGHLHVEEDQIGIVLANETDALDSVFALGDNIDIVNIL